jgi:glycogen synthase
MNQEPIRPDYIFETSWEVCNKIGGIYTVLSTKARTLKQDLDDHLIFIGPDLGIGAQNDFIESATLFQDWKEVAEKRNHLKIRIGRWNIPSMPIAILVDQKPFFALKNDIYGRMWEWFNVDSLHGFGDYDDASLFGYAVGTIIESFYRFYQLEQQRVIAHFNEWNTAFGLFYLKRYLPQVGTLFTTHATTVGRSIAGNNKPLYDFLPGYHGDQMAHELNVESKHSVEKQASRIADCFTTVSAITAKECTQILEKKPDVITPNGFEDDFVPRNEQFTKMREAAQAILKKVAEALLCYTLPSDTLYVATSGRYEYINKGLNLFLDSLKKAEEDNTLHRTIAAFIMVPAYISGPRHSLQQKLIGGTHSSVKENPFVTHELVEPWKDPILSDISWLHFTNHPDSKIKLIFVPSYLQGDDGIFNKSYYDLLIGMDITIFPSYYEPWGYTPLESIAFSVPTIITSLSGFGQWINPQQQPINEGIAIIERTDANYTKAVSETTHQLITFANMNNLEIVAVREKARNISQKAHWENFIQYYYEAYSKALLKKEKSS